MSTLVSADEFFAGVIAALTQASVTQLRVSDDLDEKFERIFEEYVSLIGDKNITPTFSFKRSGVHGDSRRFRETLYAARFDGIVALENPTFYQMTSKLTPIEAAYFIKSVPEGDALSKVTCDIFADEIARSNFPSPVSNG